MIAVIAATTTLAALALTALVLIKVFEAPQPQVVQQAPVTAPVQPAAAPPPVAAPAPAPAPAAEPKQEEAKAEEKKTEEEAVDPSDLPTEKEEKKAAAAPVAGKVGGPLPKKEEKKASGPPGYLTVVCDPFCDSVSAGGKNLGPSPVVRAALPPGPHGVVLRRKGAPAKSIGVTIKSGQTTARRVKMGS